MIVDREGPISPPCSFRRKLQGDGLARRNTISHHPGTPGILAPMIVMDFDEDDHLPALPAARTLERFITAAANAIPLRGDLSVLITSDQNMRRLNRRYRGKNKPTDVLSFPAGPDAAGQTLVAGDLAISLAMAARQALLLEHTLTVELKILILHGMLHLAGMDHENDKGEMATREIELRRRLRLPVGLIERNDPATARVPASLRVRLASSIRKKQAVKQPRRKVAQS